MHPRTIAVDLAKNCFEVAVSQVPGRSQESHRFNRAQFAEFMANAPSAVVVMEACGSADFWGRTQAAWGHSPRLLPA